MSAYKFGAVMRFKAAVFDLDGTLLDTLDDLADSANAVLRRRGFPEHPRDAYKYFVGDGMEVLVRRAVPQRIDDPQVLAACAALMREEYARRWADKSRPYDGIATLLDGLTARGVRMAVLSNKPQEFTRLSVARMLAAWRFEEVLGASPELPRKPDPTGALRIAARLRLAAEEVAYLGDTNTDMQTAVTAGMYPVGALWGFRTAEELTACGARLLLERPEAMLELWSETA